MVKGRLPTRGRWMAQSSQYGFAIWREDEEHKAYKAPLAMILNGTPQCEANAKLVAAAPELLQALIGLSKQKSYLSIKAAKAAIEKALL